MKKNTERKDYVTNENIFQSTGSIGSSVALEVLLMSNAHS